MSIRISRKDWLRAIFNVAFSSGHGGAPMFYKLDITGHNVDLIKRSPLPLTPGITLELGKLNGCFGKVAQNPRFGIARKLSVTSLQVLASKRVNSFKFALLMHQKVSGNLALHHTNRSISIDQPCRSVEITSHKAGIHCRHLPCFQKFSFHDALATP
jgi:hypothetical protein